MLLAIAPIALARCATPAAAQAELADLKAEVRALRQELERLEARLDRAELRAGIGAAAAPAAARPAAKGLAIPDPGPEPVPTLTVVKLKPKQQAAPKLATGVPIVEPNPEILEELKRAPAAATAAAEKEDADVGEAEFEFGVNALKTGNVEGGVVELQRFATDSPRHPRADNALYFSGLGLMGLGDYEGAARAFEDVLTRYPAGDAVLESMLKLGECRIRLNKPAEARTVYQKIVTTYPGTSAASAAQARLSSLTAAP
jgi:tol-pal system protein YbgF